MSRASAATAGRVHRKTVSDANWQQWISEAAVVRALPEFAQEAVPATPTEPGGPAISHEAIAHLAYTMWEARGCPHGSAEVDWVQAERELRNRATAANV